MDRLLIFSVDYLVGCKYGGLIVLGGDNGRGATAAGLFAHVGIAGSGGSGITSLRWPQSLSFLPASLAFQR